MIWTTLGVSVAIVAVFCVSVVELVVGHPIFERSRGYIAVAFTISGIVAWFLGRFLARRRLANKPEDEKDLRPFRSAILGADVCRFGNNHAVHRYD